MPSQASDMTSDRVAVLLCGSSIECDVAVAPAGTSRASQARRRLADVVAAFSLGCGDECG
jgi:hypothetical protein